MFSSTSLSQFVSFTAATINPDTKQKERTESEWHQLFVTSALENALVSREYPKWVASRPSSYFYTINTKPSSHLDDDDEEKLLEAFPSSSPLRRARARKQLLKIEDTTSEFGAQLRQFGLFGVATTCLCGSGVCLYLAFRRPMFIIGVPWAATIAYLSWQARDNVMEELQYIQKLKQLRQEKKAAAAAAVKGNNNDEAVVVETAAKK